MTISVSPAHVTRLLTFVVGALAVAGLASVAVKHALGGESVGRVVHLFNLDVEPAA